MKAVENARIYEYVVAIECAAVVLGIEVIFTKSEYLSGYFLGGASGMAIAGFVLLFMHLVDNKEKCVVKKRG